MQLRSGRRLSPPRAPAPRGQRRHLPAPRRPEVDGGAGGDVEADRISSLPDDLLLLVLDGCALETARTSVLARRWRGLWTQLPVLIFDYVPVDVIEASLAQVSRPLLDFLHINVDLNGETAGRVSSLLRDVVEPLAPKKLSISYEGEVEGNGYEKIMLPCFRSTTALSFLDHGRFFSLPPAGSKFEALTTLQLYHYSDYLEGLVPMCPSLRYLKFTDSFGDVIIHSPSLEELFVDTMHNTDADDDEPPSVIDISAPLLKKATFGFDWVSHFRVSLSAPMVKQINWHVKFFNKLFKDYCPVRISFLDYSMRHGVHNLMIYLDDWSEAEDWSFPQLPLLPHHLSILKLEFYMSGHAFAALVLHVLQILPVTAHNVEVELTRARKIGAQCPGDCPCEQVINSNWRNENIKLTDLEAVTLVGFNGHDEEVDFLKVLFRCATVLKSMTVKVSSEGHKKISNICEQYPYVKCRVLSMTNKRS